MLGWEHIQFKVDCQGRPETVREFNMWVPGRPFQAEGIIPAEVLSQVYSMFKKQGGQLV